MVEKDYKPKGMNLGVLGVLLVMVAMVVLGSFAVRKIRKDMEVDKNVELEMLRDKKEVSNLKMVIINDMVSNFNSNGKYMVTKNDNLLKDPGNRQLWVSSVIMDSDSGNLEEIKSYLTIVDEEVMEYFSYEKFNLKYKELFGEEFDIDKRIRSGKDTEYDNNEEYVYYNKVVNDRIRDEDVSIGINKVSFDKDMNLYTANMDIKYSEEVGELLGYDSDKGQLQYEMVNGKMVFKTLLVG